MKSFEIPSEDFKLARYCLFFRQLSEGRAKGNNERFKNTMPSLLVKKRRRVVEKKEKKCGAKINKEKIIMAVEKSTLNGYLTDGQLADVNRIEELIDKHLKEKFIGPRLRLQFMNCPILSDLRVRQELVRRYQKAGWDIQFFIIRKDDWDIMFQ